MTDAEQLFFAGGAHARAAHALIAATNKSVHMAVPFYLLVGFSIEIVLKAAFIQLGGGMNYAKDVIRHDLPKALAAASENGFQPENKQLNWLVETMADVHRNHSFRYLAGDNELRVADESCCLSILDDLVAQVGKLIYPDHGRDFWIERLQQFEPNAARPTEAS